MIKSILICVFVAIMFNLGNALYHLVKYKEEASSQKTVKALTNRIGLSVLLFLFVFILLVTGAIQPHGIGAKIHPLTNTSEKLISK